MTRIIMLLALMILMLCFLDMKSSQAEIITFYPTEVLGGGTVPEGDPPWIAASFDDHGRQGSVTLTLSCLNLTGDEFVSKWLFNLDPGLDPRKLGFGSLVKTGSFNTPSILTGTNQFTGGGGDKFDVLFNFATSNKHSRRFDDDNSLQLVISGISTLTAKSFDFQSKGNSDYGGILPAKTEAHIQGIGDCRDDSAWIVVPEPSSLVLACCGMLGMTLYVRNSQRIARGQAAVAACWAQRDRLRTNIGGPATKPFVRSQDGSHSGRQPQSDLQPATRLPIKWHFFGTPSPWLAVIALKRAFRCVPFLTGSGFL